MCGEESVKTLIQLAKEQENVDAEKSARNYLEAAQLLLTLSDKFPNREPEFIAMANRIYAKAKSLRGESINYIPQTSNDCTFQSIGGLQDLKEEIMFKIIKPLQHPEIFQHYGKTIGGGILMFGPPGCGKSLIAKATAHEAKANFFHIKSSDLRSKYVGETEKNIAELFEKARKQSPAIIFFDEFEVLGADRTHSLSHEKSAVAQLLTEMDGMDAKNQEILLLAATNEPWSIDPALRREGRFGTTIYIPPPDKESRVQILKLHLGGRPIRNLDLTDLAHNTEGLSGADLKALCERAADIPLKESFTTGKKRPITMEDFTAALNQQQSVLDQWFAKAREQVEHRNLQESFPVLADLQS